MFVKDRNIGWRGVQVRWILFRCTTLSKVLMLCICTTVFQPGRVCVALMVSSPLTSTLWCWAAIVCLCRRLQRKLCLKSISVQFSLILQLQRESVEEFHFTTFAALCLIQLYIGVYVERILKLSGAVKVIANTNGYCCNCLPLKCNQQAFIVKESYSKFNKLAIVFFNRSKQHIIHITGFK